MITAIALIPLPGTITEDGTAKLMLKISTISRTPSSINVIFTVLLLVPRTIVTVCVVESKSLLFPT